MPELIDVAELIMGQSPPSSTYNENGNGVAFFQGKSDFGFRYPTPRLFCSAPMKLARPRDILMSVRAPVGPTNIADQECCIGRGLAAIRPRDVDGEFLFFNLRYIEKFIASLGTGSTFHAINKSQLGSVEVNPHGFDISEQQKIAAVLGLVQRAIEQQERLIALTAELKKTLLHQLFTQGLRGEPQKETEIGLIPQSWNPTPLGECCDILGGSLSYTDFLKMASTDEDGTVECMGVKVSDMNLPGNESRFVIANLAKRLPVAIAQRKLIPSNTLVFPKRGAAIATNKKRLTTTWTVLDPNLIGVCAKDTVDSEFLFYWSQTFDLRKITDPGTTPQLNKKDLVPVLLPLPNEMEEQQEIAHAISCVDSKLRFHQQKIGSLTDLFRTLLHQLMTAQIRVDQLDLSHMELRRQ